MAEQDLAGTQRRLSNVGHWVEGGLFLLLGALALLQTTGTISGGARYAAPVLLVAAGAFLPIFLLGHGHNHGGGDHRKQLLADPQQRQHLVMAGLLFVSGLTELALAAGWVSIAGLAYVWPASLVIIGVMFMLHTQHGDHAAMAKAIRFHRILGTAIALAGITRGVQIATRTFDGPLAYASPLLLLVVAALLVTYREPEGAYAGAGAAQRGGHGH
jgi:hypothetical protein